MKITNDKSIGFYVGLLFITLTIVLCLGVFFQLLSLYGIQLIWGIDAGSYVSDYENGVLNYIDAHKFSALFSQLGMFLIPATILFVIFKLIRPTFNKPVKKDYLKLILFLVLLIGITQLLSSLTIFIGYDFLPDYIQNYLKTQQEFSANLQEKFIQLNWNSFIFNIFLLAFLPAISEELFFRGLVQKIFTGIFQNTTIGIISTSIIFGLLHFQIDNLLAIVSASILFGFIYEKSGNILLTIILHFCFNLFSLVNMQAIKMEYVSENQLENVGYYIIIPLSLIAGVFILKRKVFWKNELLLPID